jgi:BirA family biotin operon repressor/biotin-[acetyl-CoA-carboxylase] ligase
VSGISILDHDVLDSTNNEAKRIAAHGRDDAFVVSANRQTAGRGRFSRVWHAPDGNVAMTIVLPRTDAHQNIATLALMNGLVLHEVLQELVREQATVRIKWPNDIVVDDAKISGTLIESDMHRLYVGIGINLVAEPAQVIYPTTSLGRFCSIERLALIERIAARWLARFDDWMRDGFAPIAGAYTAALWRHGQPISIALNEAKTERVDGICRGVNETGLLLLELPGGAVRAFSTGDVGA